MPDYKCLIYEVKDAVATLTLNRPERLNALGDTLRDDLYDAVLRASQDPEIRVLVVTGAGKGFCAGGDVKAMNDTKEGRAPARGQGGPAARPRAAGDARRAQARDRRGERRGRRRRDEPGARLRHPPGLDRREVHAGVRQARAASGLGRDVLSAPSGWHGQGVRAHRRPGGVAPGDRERRLRT